MSRPSIRWPSSLPIHFFFSFFYSFYLFGAVTPDEQSIHPPAQRSAYSLHCLAHFAGTFKTWHDFLSTSQNQGCTLLCKHGKLSICGVLDCMARYLKGAQGVIVIYDEQDQIVGLGVSSRSHLPQNAVSKIQIWCIQDLAKNKPSTREHSSAAEVMHINSGMKYWSNSNCQQM